MLCSLDGLQSLSEKLKEKRLQKALWQLPLQQSSALLRLPRRPDANCRMTWPYVEAVML